MTSTVARASTRLLSALLAAIAGCASGEAASQTLAGIDPALAKVQREVWDVWFAGDTVRLKEIIPPDLVVINSGGGNFSSFRDEVASSANFSRSGGRLLELTFPEMRVQQFGDVVVVYTQYRLAFVMGSDTTRQSGRATEVFVKRDGKWVNPAWHMDSGT
jgi:hypothetical protein